MNDIFISYANTDRAVAQQLADALEALGWSVWWDREIPFGKAFDQVIEQELNAARCVIVLWSKESVQSRWVKTEAAVAADRDRLIPVLIDDVAIPLEFRRIQTAMLPGWRGDRNHPDFGMIVDSIRQMLAQPELAPAARARSPTPPPSTSPLGTARKPVLFGIGAAVIALLLLGAVALLKSRDSQQDASVEARTDTSNSRKGDVKGAFRIKIGDRIEDGVPAPGAGNIEKPGAVDVYSFDAKPGQRVYFRRFSHDRGMEQIKWTLADVDGAEVFDARLYYEPGTQVLRKGGRYTMSVGSEQARATGTYRLQLFDVPAPKSIAIKIGDKIRENVPSTGAGTIASPGATNVYTFTATAGDRVYFRRFEYGTGMEQIGWMLTDSDDQKVFDTRLYDEPGVHVLRKGGTYSMTIGSTQVPATGNYHLQLFAVPRPDQFTTGIGDTIKEGSPGRGAGFIESPGAKDVYTFSAAPGQNVQFRRISHDPGMEQIGWAVIDEDGTEVLNARLYEQPGVKVLRKGGKYTMTIGSDRVPATGAYSVQISGG
jgi:hypothetical protein